MFDRWRKLLKAFYNEKKRQFDISKVTVSSVSRLYRYHRGNRKPATGTTRT